MRNGHAIILLAILLFSFSAKAEPRFDHEPIMRAFRHDIETGDRIALAERTNRAIDGIVNVAIKQLRLKREWREASRIEGEWRRFNGMLVGIVKGNEDLGDHAALNGWLQVLYILLEAKLGPAIMSITHLDDLNILNMAIPVVFHLDIIDDPETIDEVEFGKHWEPLAGCLAYWGTFISCEVVTYAGGTWWLCTPAGMVAELATVEFVAPYFTPVLWKKFYPENVGDQFCSVKCQ